MGITEVVSGFNALLMDRWSEDPERRPRLPSPGTSDDEEEEELRYEEEEEEEEDEDEEERKQEIYGGEG